MFLDNLLEKLSFGPLSDLSQAGEGTGTVSETFVPKAVLAANSALTALYTQFPLQTRSIMLRLSDGMYEYPLRREYAQTSDSDEPVKFIVDSPIRPFMGDILMITDVLDSCHKPLPLNDRRNKYSWFRTSYDTLSMDYAREGDLYFVNYRARHPEIPVNPVDPSEVEILIPFQLEEALLEYIAYKVYRSMNMEGAVAKAILHEQRYKEELQIYEGRNTFDSSAESSNIIPYLRGWPR